MKLAIELSVCTSPTSIMGCSKIVCMSSSENPKVDPSDLQDASRERLLTEIGLLQHKLRLTNIPNLELQLAQLRGELADLEMRILQMRDFNIGCAAELGEAKANLAKNQNDLNRERQQIKAIYASSTWKIGRFILLPIRILRRILKAD